MPLLSLVEGPISALMSGGTPGTDELQVVMEEVLGQGETELEDFKDIGLIPDVTEDISVQILLDSTELVMVTLLVDASSMGEGTEDLCLFLNLCLVDIL